MFSIVANFYKRHCHPHLIKLDTEQQNQNAIQPSMKLIEQELAAEVKVPLVNHQPKDFRPDPWQKDPNFFMNVLYLSSHAWKHELQFNAAHIVFKQLWHWQFNEENKANQITYDMLQDVELKQNILQKLVIAPLTNKFNEESDEENSENEEHESSQSQTNIVLQSGE